MSITERRLTAVLVALLTVCVIAAASTAFLLGRRAAVADAPADRPPSASTPGSTPSVSSPGSTAASSSAVSSPISTATTTRPSPAQTPPPATPPSVSKPPATGAVLDPPVAMSAQAGKHPDAVKIRELTSLNFRSINTLDYQLWVDTVTPEQSAAFGPVDWLNAYRTSEDSDITIVSIDPDTRWITMTFVSTQSADKAPSDAPSTCLDWKVVRPVVAINGKLRFAKSVEGLSSYRACP